uniref:MMS1_N domain-containing protein n=1 Tax=Panagrellus redivivus TaxID=6233 RepID=A0A7E4VIG7_PANRE
MCIGKARATANPAKTELPHFGSGLTAASSRRLRFTLRRSSSRSTDFCFTMHTVIGETDVETSVHLTEYGQFIADGSRQLIAVGGKVLRLFRMNPYTAKGPQLECIAQYKFIAPIEAISKVRLPGFQFDCMIICFDDGKVCIQYICPAKRDLEIVSLHEIHPDTIASNFEKTWARNFVAGDPDNRCVVALVRDAYFLVIPIPEKLPPEFWDEYDEDQNNGVPGTVIRRPRQKLTNYDIKLHDLDKTFHSISDFVIPSGQYVPTVIIMYEPKKTTAGRAHIEYDTVCISAITFNLKERQTVITWQVSGLPMSLQRMLHIPEPVNGLLLCGVNEIIYVHQNAPGYGVSLNGNGCRFSKFALEDSNIVAVLDGVVPELLSPYEVLLGSRAGELFVATIDTDAMNSVRSIFLQKVSDIPIPSTMVSLSRGYLYVGSKINDCALLSYTKKCTEKTLPSLEEFSKAGITDDIINSMNPEDPDYDKTVSNFFYSETDEEIAIIEAPIKPQEYTFQTAQTFLNTAPFKKTHLCVAEEIDEAFKEDVSDHVFDIAAASGHAKDSKLLFFERTVRPHIGSSLPLKNISCCFTAGRLNDTNSSHHYVFLSREMDTMVLDSTKNLSGLHQTPFCTNEGTIAASDLCDGTVVCQVSVHRIILAKDDRQIREIVVDSEGEVFVQDAYISDPYVAVSLNTGGLLLFQITANGDDVRINQLDPPEDMPGSDSKTTCLTLYKDNSGLFRRRAADNSNALPKIVIVPDDADPENDDNLPEDPDEVSKEFYSTRKRDIRKESNVEKNRRLRTTVIDSEFDNWTAQTDSSLPNPAGVEPGYFLLLAKEDGGIYFFAIPSFDLVFVAPGANSLWTVLVDDPHFGKYNKSLGFEPPEDNEPQVKRARPMTGGLRSYHTNRICELKLYGTGPNGQRPVLGLLVDDMVTFYEAFPFDNFLDDHLMVRFKKLERFVCVRRQHYIREDQSHTVETISIGVKVRPRYINFAAKMGSMENVIIATGGYPTILYMGSNGAFQHPLAIDGPINGFCYLRTPAIQHGFVYIKDDQIRIGEVSLRAPAVNYDTPYPCRVLPMGTTVNHMTYIYPFNLFAVAVSEPEEYSSIVTVSNDEHHEIKCEYPDRFVLPTRDKCTLKLFTREDYAFIPNNDVEFKEFEEITCVEEVILSTLGSKTGLMNYLAIGTSFNMGEEVPARGRLIIYEIIEVVPEVGLPTTRFKLKPLAEMEQKGRVCAISSTEGVLLVGVGQRVFVFTIKDEGLVAISFMDLKYYVSSIIPFRSIALATDLFASVHLLRYQKEFKVLSEVASDDRKVAPRISRVGYVVNNQNVAFIAADGNQNMLVFEHLPDTRESKCAQRLITTGAIRIGAVATNFVRVHAHVADSMVARLQEIYAAQTTMFTTKEGSWGFVRPVHERYYRRYLMLQNFVEGQMQQSGGLNPHGARAVRPQRTGTDANFANAKQHIDGDMLVQFLGLDSCDKEEFARRMGTTKYQIIDDIVEYLRVVTHF